MSMVLGDGSKLPPYIVLDYKTVPKEQLPRRMIVGCKPEGWVTDEFVKILLAVMWNRTEGQGTADIACI
jgi:hypothetical protein